MGTINRIHIAALSVLLSTFTGCADKKLIETSGDGLVETVFAAVIESSDSCAGSKTTLGGKPSDSERKVLWLPSDEICVGAGVSSSKFTNDEPETASYASFSGLTYVSSLYYAAYPYSMVKSFGSDTFTFDLPYTQYYYKDGVGNGSFPMVAQCSDGVFHFKNICGILVLNLVGSDEIVSITFTGRDAKGNDMPVSGRFTVPMTYSDVPVLHSGSASTTVRLDCRDSSGRGIKLSNAATPFHLVLPPGDYASFQLCLSTFEGKLMLVNSSKPLTVARSSRTTTASLTYSGEFKPEYVDLGLSVKWATFNVGASMPEDYGGKYAWGEQEQKSSSSWSNYKYCNGSSSTLTKYCTSMSYGYSKFVDMVTVLDLSDDVAHVSWGGKWRMPTREEYQELIDKCQTVESTIGNHSGKLYISKMNGDTIFMPKVNYWTSSCEISYPYCGYYIYSSGSIGTDDRYEQYYVRPVWDDAVGETGVVLDRTELELTVGQTAVLTAKIASLNPSGLSMTWSSSDETVAKVDGKGHVTAVSAGTATITVSLAGGYSASCLVSVTMPLVSYEYVDMGLSVKWATFNVGASVPESKGGLYAWGEIVTKHVYDWGSYDYCADGNGNNLTKYCSSSNYGYNGFTDGKTVLEPEDDAAHMIWGGKWRMPTRDEFDELHDKCVWEEVTVDGVSLWKVTSKYNGASIYMRKTDYWSSTCYSIEYLAYYQYSNSSKCSDVYRYYGKSIRPVWDDAVGETGVVLDRTELEMSAGQTATLTARPASLNPSGLSMTWSSSDETVAKVDNKGHVISLSAGTATVTVSLAGGYSASCRVSVTGTPASYEYVDMGLSVKWATFNVGASVPESKGGLYAWGEIVTKHVYDWGSYDYCANGNGNDLTKYCSDSYYGYNGFTDGKTVLEPEDDAAHMIWGGKWRMPTRDEFDELHDKCVWEEVTVGGVSLWKVTSKYNGASIYMRKTDYWSSTCYSNQYHAYYQYSKSNKCSSTYRYYGKSIRPVWDDAVGETGVVLVDLGLSVKWATCNVGATRPEDYGYYFEWGETQSKSVCNWSDYKYCKGSETTMTKYCYDSSYGYNGYTDGKTVLDLEDDAAHVNWGGDWRMPTCAEFVELSDSSNCTWIWTTMNGIDGYKVISNKSGYAGNYIFLPAAGGRDDEELYDLGNSGYYWSNSLDEDYSSNAQDFYFDSDNYHTGNYYRYHGRSVRPVCQ